MTSSKQHSKAVPPYTHESDLPTPSNSTNRRPNTSLTQDEKIAKRNRKKHLKQKTKIHKYKTRLTQALSRRDHVTAERARRELATYYETLQQDADSVWYQAEFATQQDGAVTLDKEQQSEVVQQGRQWITLQIWQKLIVKLMAIQQSPPDNATSDMKPSNTHEISSSSVEEGLTIATGNNNAALRKQIQIQHARKLLHNMTKGTQTENMFDNDTALLGYTRQKFSERAFLALASLDRLYPLLRAEPSEPNTIQLWQRLLQVQSVVSIGCGPGCDAVGALSFLRQHRQGQPGPTLQRVLLLDYVMAQWERLVLNDLLPLLSPKHVSSIDTATCDVRYPLRHGQHNQSALDSLAREQGHGWDLIVVSYLLTETREQWKDFFGDLLDQLLKPDSNGHLFLLSEPTAWQLHAFLNTFADSIIAHQWLDSSRDTPELQSLEGRMGPAVLLVYTK